MFSDDGAGLVSQVTSSESYYYLADGLGSTMVTVDSDGDVVNEYTYDAFGATRSESGAQANEFQFAGEQVDGSTGLQYLRARYYDMETGRFISREPLMAAPGWTDNPYSYACCNPHSYVDPTGLAASGAPSDGHCQDLWDRLAAILSILETREEEYKADVKKLDSDGRRTHKNTFEQWQSRGDKAHKSFDNCKNRWKRLKGFDLEQYGRITKLVAEYRKGHNRLDQYDKKSWLGSAWDVATDVGSDVYGGLEDLSDAIDDTEYWWKDGIFPPFPGPIWEPE